MEHEQPLSPIEQPLPVDITDEVLTPFIEEQSVVAQQVFTEVRTSYVNQLIGQTLMVAGVAGIVALALSKEQRIAIREGRDEGRCQFPHPHGDECEGNLQVHHITPQRYLKDKGYQEEEIDVPENLITCCEHAHHDHIHLDMRRAKKRYREDKNSYKREFSLREHALQQGRPYWNTAYDKALKIIAGKRTVRAMREGWEYPLKRQQKHERELE